MREIVLIGGGGHCKSCIEVIEAENKFKIAGIVDVKEKLGQEVLGYEIIAGDEDLPKLVEQYEYFLISIGQTKAPDKRIEKFEYLKKLNAKFPVIISPFAYVSGHSKIEEGTIIMHQAFVNADVKIGKSCIINTQAIIEHESIVADHCHISTGSIVNGQCRIGEGSFIGSNSVLSNNIDIAKGTIMGAGSVIVKSIAESGTYIGNTRKIR